MQLLEKKKKNSSLNFLFSLIVFPPTLLAAGKVTLAALLRLQNWLWNRSTFAEADEGSADGKTRKVLWVTPATEKRPNCDKMRDGIVVERRKR